MLLAPIGAFGGMAFTIGKYGIATLLPLGKLMLTVYLTMAVFIFLVLGAILRYCRIGMWSFLSYIKAELLIVLGTSSSEAGLPGLMEKLEGMGCAQPVVGLVVPTGYSFNLDGTTIYLSLSTLFLAQVFHIDLSAGPDSDHDGHSHGDQQGRGRRGGQRLRGAGQHAHGHEGDSGGGPGPAAGRRPVYVGSAVHHQLHRQRRGHGISWPTPKVRWTTKWPWKPWAGGCGPCACAAAASPAASTWAKWPKKRPRKLKVVGQVAPRIFNSPRVGACRKMLCQREAN